MILVQISSTRPLIGAEQAKTPIAWYSGGRAAASTYHRCAIRFLPHRAGSCLLPHDVKRRQKSLNTGILAHYSSLAPLVNTDHGALYHKSADRDRGDPVACLGGDQCGSTATSILFCGEHPSRNGGPLGSCCIQARCMDYPASANPRDEYRSRWRWKQCVTPSNMQCKYVCEGYCSGYHRTPHRHLHRRHHCPCSLAMMTHRTEQQEECGVESSAHVRIGTSKRTLLHPDDEPQSSACTPACTRGP